MAYDEGHAQIMRDSMTDIDGISEKKMFGGLCFLLYGNMVCGVHKGGGMFRVGKSREAEALAIEGAAPLTFTGRPMGGMIEVDEANFADDENLAKWIQLSLTNAMSLPPK
ncbi:MAG: TfoX/Sxy family protein [Pseudoruegeria sp.]